MAHEDREALEERLSRISTLWSELFQAHATGDAAVAAQRALLQRYSGAVYRYFLGAVRDEDLAQELTQELAYRFLRGDFHRIDPQRGRFRDYLKTALVHLVNDHHRKRQQEPEPLLHDCSAPPKPESDADFLATWREELLERTWKALQEANPHYHAVLLFRVDHPEVPSAAMAEQLSVSLGKPLTASSVRKTLQRAHEKYADLLTEEVALSLEQPTPAALEQELQELKLMKYCQEALQRRRE
jgi:RNA polymerase sigma-70 factor (ECF subfamily)